MTRLLPPVCYLLLATLALALPGVAAAAGVDDSLAVTRKAIRELVRKEMQAKDTVGLSLALVDDQKLLWAEGFGFANREKRQPAGADTRYSAGALSMLLTAAAVLQFADQGALELDQPIRKLLPEFAPRSRFAATGPITVRQLLTHHAGLPGMHFRDMWTLKPEPLATFVARLSNESLAAPPGHVYSPSFPGYDVLGHALETLCKKSFADCLHERLLTPLGMKRSSFDQSYTGVASQYWSEKPVPAHKLRDVPAVGLITSAPELARFVQMILGQGRLDDKNILKTRSVREMLTVQNARVALDLDNRVGLAWRLTGVNFPQARSVAWLNNDSPFSRGRVLIVPEHKLGVIVLTNSSGSTEVVKKVSERLMQLVLEQRKLPVAKEPASTAVTAVTPPPARGDIEGKYTSLIGLISVKAAGGHYRARALGKSMELNVTREGLLAPAYRLLGLIPIPISTLKETRLTVRQVAGHHLVVAYYRNAAYRFGERIAPVKLSETWRKRLGEYQAVTRDPLLDLVKMGNVHLAYADGQLYFRYSVPGWLGLLANIPVRPLSDHELVVEGTGWLMGESVQVVTRDGQETLRYSGYELRRVPTP